jgi:hypothetical protein
MDRTVRSCTTKVEQLTSGCRSSPSGCGRGPSLRRRQSHCPCSKCQWRRCTADGPGRSGRRSWRKAQWRSDRKGNVVYYESIKREPKIRGIYECRCDERLQTKSKEFTRLTYTGLVLELEHLKPETRLISERFSNAMGECEN